LLVEGAEAVAEGEGAEAEDGVLIGRGRREGWLKYSSY
jgi:hypothetical protein